MTRSELSDERRVALERRLSEVQVELADLAKERLHFIVGDTATLRERSETLETEADAIRRELGLPAAPGRPPRADGLGWTLVCGGAVVAGVVLWLVTR
ncbi:hypothetical protein [Microbacterium sp. 3J1]|uniref:hypothetical protein n=1 Tax=Microbacterium sp. 3J1 TaxID=861269 RepID=UPI000A9B77BB|nr:hypothetical protein [Microbacterium sp. 3J1]